MQASRSTTVFLFLGAVSDQTRDFAPGITTETLSGATVTVTPASGLAISSVAFAGTEVRWRMTATVAGTYRVDVLAELDDGEVLDHRVNVFVR